MCCAGLLGLGSLACTGASEGTRVVEVRSVTGARPARAGELVTLTPAATPTFPTLQLRPPQASELHLSRGWQKSEADLVFRGGSTIRFWVGEPRPLRLRGGARLVSTRRDPTAVLEISLGESRLGTVEISGRFAELRFELPAHALRTGTNILSLRLLDRTNLLPLSKLVAVNELIVEDGEDPQPQPCRQVELVIEGEERVKRGLQVLRAGALSFLLHPPGSARQLQIGIVCLRETETSAEPPRLRVTAQADNRHSVLLDGNAAYGHIQWHRIPVNGFAGAPLRLDLELDHIPDGASCIWVEPRVGADDEARSGPSTPALRMPGTNLIVVILDAATRDRFGVYGSEPSTTPAIDALALESLVFDRAVVQASYTLASTASLFTGRLPPVHRVTSNNNHGPAALPTSVPTLASLLAGVGYHTAMFTGNPNSVRNNLSRGFQELNELYRVHKDPVTRAEDFKEPVLDWVEGQANEPFFLYIHYVQPHQPYDVAPKRFYLGLDPHYDGEFRGSRQVMRQLYHGRLKADADDVEHIRGLYHGNLRYADWAVGELVAALDESGILERSILVLTADHGEGLGERGVFGHGRSVDREVSPAPLIIRFPSRLGLVGRRAFPVGNADIMATLLDVVGGPVPQGIWGRSFLPMLEDSAAGLWPRPLPSWAGGGRAGTVAVYGGGGYKYSYDSIAGLEKLFTFEEEEDGEDVRASHPVTFDYLAFSSFVPDAQELPRAGSTDQPGLDAENLEALRALGYVE